jgi:uncharacterized membrane protein YoaK (UPF0700 family)
MPISYLRGLTGKVRSGESDRQLAMFLAFIAGAANAGGFLAVRQYTSHMSGIVSSMADGLALRDLGVVLAGVGAVISFMAGAAATAVMVNWGRRRGRHGVYAMPLMVEAGLLLVFGVLGSDLARERVGVVPATVMLLCFTMGLQNAIITKISHAVIRTTHVTGMVTDIGIELGKLVYWNTGRHEGEVRADWGKLGLLGSLVGLFFVGGVVGAVGFKDLGFVSTVPLAVMLVVLAGVPVMDDLRGRG